MALLGGDEEGVPSPGIGKRLVGRGAGRVHLLDVDSGMLLEEVDPAAGPLDLAARGGRDRHPVSAIFAEVLDQGRNRAVRGDQVLHHIIDRLEFLRLVGRPPGREGQHVVTGLRLRLGGDRQQVLVALRGDVVDLDLDLFFRGPLVAHLGEHVVAARDPVVPEADF